MRDKNKIQLIFPGTGGDYVVHLSKHLIHHKHYKCFIIFFYYVKTLKNPFPDIIPFDYGASAYIKTCISQVSLEKSKSYMLINKSHIP